MIVVLAAKQIGAGCAAAGLAGAGVGIGIIFAGLIASVARAPGLERKLVGLAVVGFALCESIALFSLLIVFILLFG